MAELINCPMTRKEFLTLPMELRRTILERQAGMVATGLTVDDFPPQPEPVSQWEFKQLTGPSYGCGGADHPENWDDYDE